MPGGSAGFSTKSMIRSCLVDMHDAEADSFHARHFQAADRHIRTGIDVLLQHPFVVHLVDMVAGQDDHVLDAVILDDVDILVNRVGCAFVPLRLRDALAGRKDVEALVPLRAEEVPAALHVADQRVRLVLGGDADAANAGIQRVRQGEVDDACLAAEINGRLGTPIGEFLQAAPPAAGQNISHCIAGKWLNAFFYHCLLLPPVFKSQVQA